MRIRVPAVGLALFLGATTAGGAPSLRRAIQDALSERDPRARAVELDRVLRTASGADDAATIFSMVLARDEGESMNEVAVGALGALADPAVLDVLAAKALEGPFRERCMALEVVGRSRADWAGGEKAAGLLRDASVDPEPMVRAAAFTSMGDLGAASLREPLERGLHDPDPVVRSAAIHGLGRIGDEKAVPALAAALRGEKGRLVDDLSAALQAVGGQRFGASPERWERWWAEKQGGTAPPPGPEWTAPRPAFLSGLVVTRSRRILFVLSVAKTMDDAVNGAPGPPEVVDPVLAAGADLVKELGEATTKLEVARTHLRAMIRTLEDGVEFDVMVYSGSPTFAFGRLTPADDRSRKRAEARVRSLSAGGYGNLHGALARVFDPKGRDPYTAADGPDTVVLLTDGNLEEPGSEDRLEVGAGVRRWNRARQILFLPVAVGTSEHTLLATLASGPPRGRVVGAP